MNDAQRKAIRDELEKRTKRATESKDSAREFLIKEGFYTKEGELAVSYGGKKTA